MLSDGLPQIRCAENIALLSVLGQVPAAPSRNGLGRSPVFSPRRSLLLQAERDLCSTLAFISSIKDDRNRVTAVCVQEEESSLRVLIAANAQTYGACGDGTYLQAVQAGFEEIFAILRTASTGKSARSPEVLVLSGRVASRDELEDQVFKAITATCRGRIMKRARLIDRGDKPPVQQVLRDAVQGLARLGNDQNKRAFGRLANGLIRRLDDLSNGYTSAGNGASALDAQLRLVVEGFLELSKLPCLSTLLLDELDRIFPIMQRGLRESLLNILGKVAQYRTSATRLAKMARGCAALRRASVTIVALLPGAFRRPPTQRSNEARNIVEALQRIADANRARFNPQSACQKLHKTVKNANGEYTRTLGKSLESSKIHAEMQLVWYLETHTTQPPPRVIAASKDACYLCNAFILAQGKYGIPGSHGRVYPGWRLPATDMADLQEMFNARLEELIVERASHIMSHGVGKVFCPLESTLFSPMGSMSTVLTVTAAAADDGEHSDSDDGVTPRQESVDGSLQSGDSEVTLTQGRASSTPGPVEAVPAMGCAPLAPDEEPPSPDARDGCSCENRLPWQTVLRGTTSNARLSASLQLHVEYTASPGASSRPLQFRIHEAGCGYAAGWEDPEAVYDVSRDLWGSEGVSCRTGCRFVNLRLGGQLFRVELG